VSVSFLSEKKRVKTEAASEKKEVAPAKPRRRPSSMLEPYRASDLWKEFDRAFERFRRDFESILWSPRRLLERKFPMMSRLESNLPSVDLEDKSDRYLLTAEVPGFKKKDIAIQVGDDIIEISGCRETKRD
jgi:HSP20 family molecular chaperone IbpA